MLTTHSDDDKFEGIGNCRIDLNKLSQSQKDCMAGKRVIVGPYAVARLAECECKQETCSCGHMCACGKPWDAIQREENVRHCYVAHSPVMGLGSTPVCLCTR